jgi:hypothetical protein
LVNLLDFPLQFCQTFANREAVHAVESLVPRKERSRGCRVRGTFFPRLRIVKQQATPIA